MEPSANDGRVDSAEEARAREQLAQKAWVLAGDGELEAAARLLEDALSRWPHERALQDQLSVVRARRMIGSGEAPADQVTALVKALKGTREFGLARQLIEKAIAQGATDTWFRQQLALCTYKDEELHPETRFAQALAILEALGLGCAETTDCETLALGGAVYKRMWQQGGQIEHLFQALALYRAAYQRDAKHDHGYGGVNAAYILDLLASRASMAATRTGVEAEEAARLKAQGHDLREHMSQHVPAAAEQDATLRDQYWFVVTLAEIAFGLEDYETAGEHLARAAGLEAREWECETTFRQLVELARLRQVTPPAEEQPAKDWHPAWQALARLLGEEATRSALGCYRGKVGLALSGGGFRASFYHLGVLARLAEMDVLRSVDVLSTVSGGSILGAHYYLMVQRLLESKTDAAITRHDYLDLVRELQSTFLAGVECNIRMRALGNLALNVRMIFSRSYSRSHRLGELYDEHLYASVERTDGQAGPRSMSDLLVRPRGEEAGFKPKFSNWRRRSRVPVLLLNTTSLNSGHSWHFTASWMGEPPGVQGSEVDTNRRYRRLYYRQAPTPELQAYRLGHAAAASSCVPGLFEPLSIVGLYRDRVVRLVDGGVHDNQGAQGLLDEGCTLVLCSDASGQMGDSTDPSSSPLGVPLRSNAILMDRVREAEHQDLQARVTSRALRGLFFVHLREGLGAAPINWEGHDESLPELTGAGTTTDYGIAPDLQEKIASLRTDLDSFTEVEAYSLMLSGYRMTEWQFACLQAEHEKSGEAGTWGGFDVSAARSGDWPFLPLEPILTQAADVADARRKDLALQLDVGNGLFFKVWRLDPLLRRLAKGVGVALGAAFVWLLWVGWNETFAVEVRVSVVVVAVLLVVAAMLWPALKWLAPDKALQEYLSKAALAVVGFLVAQLHLRLFDRRFLARGRLRRLLDLGSD